MRPKISVANIRKALRHPSLIWSLIRGHGELQLTKEHLEIHLRHVSQIEIGRNNLDPIDLVCRAIDLCSNPCYRLRDHLYLVCRYIRPEKIVETGVHHGFSSAFMLKALEETGGRLYSIDLPNVEYETDDGRIHRDVLSPESETGFVVPERLRANWELILGDSREKLPQLLQTIGEIDIFHHDSAHTYDLMTFEFETVWPHLKHDGLLLSHDADRSDAFEDFCSRHSADYRIYKGVGIGRKPGTGSNISLEQDSTGVY
jgi:hypothetical protein